MLPDPLSSGPPGSYSAGGDRAHEELAGTPLMGAGASDLMTSVLTAAKLRRCGPRAGRSWGPGPHPYLVCVGGDSDRTGCRRVPQEADHTLPVERKYGMGMLKGQIRDTSQLKAMKRALTTRTLVG